MLGLAKYLKYFGWQPTILTAPLEKKPEDGFNFVETEFPGDIFTFWRKTFSFFGYDTKRSITEQIKSKSGISSEKSLIEKIRDIYQEIFAYPDTEKKWFKPAVTKAFELMRKEKFDAIISVWPVTAHIVAKKIKEKYAATPWLADFPDPWSLNHNYPYGKIRKYFDKRLELKTILNADILTAASPGYAKKEEELHGKETICITNGFDPDFEIKERPKLTKKFTISYTGKIYPGKQDPMKIFEAIKELKEEKVIDPSIIEVNFYGERSAWLEREIKKRGMENIVFQKGVISKEESLRVQKESQVLLLFCWEDENELSVYPLKTFEYLSAKRPILATGGSGNEDIKRIINETKAGICAIKTEDIKQTVAALYEEFINNNRVEYGGDESKIDQYSTKNMARKFADALDKISL